MMRTFIALFILWAIAFDATAGNIPLIEFKTPHGINVTYFHSDTQDTVAIALAFDCGTACDGVNGTATGPLALSMLYEGADGKSSSELYESLQDVGANFSIDATPDQTYGAISAPTRGIDGAVELINSILRHPDLPESRFKRKSDTMARRAEESSIYPEAAIQKAFFKAAIGTHPYLRYFAPNPETIRAVQLIDLKPWLKSHLNLKDVIVSVVGNVDQAHAGALVDRLLEGLPQNSELRPVPAAQFEIPPAGPIFLKGDKSGQASIVVGSVFPRDAALKDWVAGYMLSSIFSGDQKSRLFKDIREGTAATYGLQPTINFYEALAVNSIRGRISADNVKGTLALIAKSWDKFRNEGPNAGEVENARAEQLNSLNVLSRNHENFAGMLRDYRTGHWSIADIASLPDVIRSVNLNDPSVLKRYFSEKPIVVVAQ
jgi:zinc protease